MVAQRRQPDPRESARPTRAPEARRATGPRRFIVYEFRVDLVRLRQSRLGHLLRKAKALLADVDRPPAGLPVGVGVLQLLDLVLQFLDVALDGDDVAADVFQRIQVGVAAIAQRVEDGF